MFGKKRAPQPKGQGAAAAKQFGLFVDLDPEEMMMGMEEEMDDPDLEAELAAITGDKAATGGRAKQKGRSPLPMEDIARMADEAMRDVDEDEDDSNLEDDEDLLAELQDVVGGDEAEEAVTISYPSPATAESSQAESYEPPPVQEKQQEVKVSSAAPGSLEHTLEERISMYKTALQKAKTAGEASKARRYDRGLKTLQTMLAAVKKGRPVNEAEIPPPVATGAPSASSRPAVPQRPAPPVPSPPESSPSEQQEQSAPEIITPSSEEQSSSSTLPTLSIVPSPEESAEESVDQLQTQANEATKTLLLGRQKEYKMAALRAKKQGDVEQAKFYLKTSKSFDAKIEALEKGQAVDLRGLPPSPGQGGPSAPVNQASSEQNIHVTQLAAAASAPTAPKDVLEALEQRRAKYAEASNHAKANGDERKARMHDRIAKQYQSAIRAHKAGKAVNFEELPVPPGFPPIPGQKATGAEHGLVAALMAADKLTSTDNAEIADEGEDEEKGEEPGVPEQLKRPTLNIPTADQGRKRSPSPSPDTSATREDPAPTAPTAPKDVLEALEQRRAKYAEASNHAKANGDERKARMHDRIAKQYQSAIRAHKAGKAVNFAELPVPPGFPPIPGQKATGAEHGLVAALMAADKLTSTDNAEIADEGEDEEKGEEPAVPEQPKRSTLNVPTASQGRKRSPSPSPDGSAARGLSPTVIQQLEFLEGRKKQYMKAALQAKQKSNMEQAKTLLRTAKGLDPMIEAVRGGKTIDIRKVPSPPADEDDDFIVVHHSDLQVSEKAEQVYTQLAEILKEQYEKCMTHSKQFTHLGNVTETTKFEKMAQGCKKSLEVLKLAQSRGLPPPKHYFEERSFHTVRIFPELSSTDMVVVIVKGMNLPAPSGIQTNDLDAYIKFDFPYPSSEQPQKHKTAVIKNTNAPEYNQSFTLSINRNHRGFRRVVSSKGIKLELLHKGGFLRSDKPIGTALVKLDKLESQSEIREIVEVMDGRKHTGGLVEVKVRLREPLSGQDMQTSTERWLVIDQSQVVI